MDRPSLVPDGWRSAWLRGVAEARPGHWGPHALVSVAPAQLLRVELAQTECALWTGHVGEVVWLAWGDGPARLRLPAPGSHHA